MRISTMSKINAIWMGAFSLLGIVFGYWAILDGYILGIISLGGGVMGLFYAVPSMLMPPFGYGSWDEYEGIRIVDKSSKEKV